MQRNASRLIVLSLTLCAFFAAALLCAAPVRAGFIPISLGAAANAELAIMFPQMPTGNQTFAGVPFVIPTMGNNVIWNNQRPHTGTLVDDFSINVAGVTEVHTLLDTTFGQPGPNSYLSLEFFGSGGAYYKKELIGNEDIRDYFNGVWTNSINNTTTVNVFAEGDFRMDKQRILLPSAFANQTLTSMRMTDAGAFDFQRAILAGITVNSAIAASAPEPGSLFLLITGLCLLVKGVIIKRGNSVGVKEIMMIRPGQSMRSLILVLLLLGLAGVHSAAAQGTNYDIKPLTRSATDHKWPSINNKGDVVWCEQVNGRWQVMKLPAGATQTTQITDGTTDYRYPTISDDGTIVYAKYGVGGGVGIQVIRDPSDLIEFSSRNNFTGDHRDAGEHPGISSVGNIISYYTFFRLGQGAVSRFKTTNKGQYPDDFFGYDYPDVNKDGDVVYAGTFSGLVYQASENNPSPNIATPIASGNRPRIADRVNGADAEIVYISGGQVVSTKNGVVDTGFTADVNTAGSVVFEKRDANGQSQVYLARFIGLKAPTSLAVTFVAATKLKLTWTDNSSDEDGFAIERKTGNGDFSQIGVTGPNPTAGGEYLDSNLEPNTDYTYRVRAFRGNDYSDYSNEASGATKSSIRLLADVNRDGIIDPAEVATMASPYRFWINNDRDVTTPTEQDDDPTALNAPLDNRGVIIQNARDLEDFTRLHIQWSDDVDLNSSDWKCTLQFTNVDIAGNPAIRVWSAATLGNEYLRDDQTARQYVGKICLRILDRSGNVDRIGVVDQSGEKGLPLDSLTLSGDRSPLLFEGVRTGNGALTIRLYYKDKKVSEDNLYLSLMDVKQMYDHFTVGDDTTTPNYAIPANYSRLYPSTIQQQTPDYILFVHGWRMKPWERRAFAETAFKRLWHIGYKGGFGLFSWPTDWMPDYRLAALVDRKNYDRSERRGYHSAKGLRNLLVDLNALHPGHINVVAHSMGNIVVSEALRLEKETGAPRQLAHVYVASQAAVTAQAYDQNVPLNTNRNDAPNVYAAFPTVLPGVNEPYFANLNRVAGEMVNYYNPYDYALTSTFTWEFNQDLKPDTGYDYYPLPRFGGFYRGLHRLYLPIEADRYEIFSFAAPAFSKALGAQAGVMGPFTAANEVNLSAAFGFTSDRYDHSAQFNSTIMKRWPYWDRLLTTFGIAH